MKTTPNLGRRIATVSLPGDLYADTRRLAKARGVNTSEIIRDALDRYRRQEDTWEALCSDVRTSFLRTGIRTESDVERMMDDIKD